MPVGNDIVDLRHPLCQPAAIHPRFDIRAFTTREIGLLAASAQVHRTRWSLWAAKESAFKAARKLDPQVRFLPRDFAVHLSGKRAEVVHRLGRFRVWLDHADQWVHALASQAGEKPGFRIAGDPSASSGAARTAEEGFSERVRELARIALSALLNIAPIEVRIVSEDRIPRAQRRGQPLPFDLSLSHDGRFVSCAWEASRVCIPGLVCSLS
ncbi:MAG: 4-phosphopantetheinyl transferase family protein [Acidobacteria bacterium]|nr:4-phosphopantetheinyl transferase family protein [Acidobacteriota bacterium]